MQRKMTNDNNSYTAVLSFVSNMDWTYNKLCETNRTIIINFINDRIYTHHTGRYAGGI